MSECEACGLGYYCPEKQMSDRISCPAGSYCNETYGTRFFVCPTGTYSNQYVSIAICYTILCFGCSIW